MRVGTQEVAHQILTSGSYVRAELHPIVRFMKPVLESQASLGRQMLASVKSWIDEWWMMGCRPEYEYSYKSFWNLRTRDHEARHVKGISY